MQSLGTYTSTEQVLLWLSFSKLIHTDIIEIINPKYTMQYFTLSLKISLSFKSQQLFFDYILPNMH